jgi:hypothetical protein
LRSLNKRPGRGNTNKPAFLYLEIHLLTPADEMIAIRKANHMMKGGIPDKYSEQYFKRIKDTLVQMVVKAVVPRSGKA